MQITLKEALHDSIMKSGVPIRKLHVQLGISYGYLANAANPCLDNFHFQLRHLIPLINATGDFTVLDYLEQECGRVAFALPTSSRGDTEITKGLLDLVRKMGALVGQMQVVLEDGLVENREFKKVEPMFFDLIKELVQVMSNTAQAVSK